MQYKIALAFFGDCITLLVHFESMSRHKPLYHSCYFLVQGVAKYVPVEWIWPVKLLDLPMELLTCCCCFSQLHSTSEAASFPATPLCSSHLHRQVTGRSSCSCQKHWPTLDLSQVDLVLHCKTLLPASHFPFCICAFGFFSRCSILLVCVEFHSIV